MSDLVFKSYIPGKGWVKATDAGVHALRAASNATSKTPTPSSAHPFGKLPDFQGMLDSLSFGSRKARSTNRYTAMRGTDPADKAFQRDMKTNDAATAKLKKAPSHNRRAMPAAGYKGFTTRHGGAKTGHSVVQLNWNLTGGARKNTAAHELAHATPKRSSYRLHRVLEDPAKATREEARADFMGGFHHTDKVKTRELFGMKGSGYQQAVRTWTHPGENKVADRTLGGSQNMGVVTREHAGEYVKVQDKMAAARKKAGKPLPKKSKAVGLEVTPKRVRNVAVVGAGAAQIKSMNQNSKSKVHKSGPDSSEVHVPGTAGKLKKIKNKQMITAEKIVKNMTIFLDMPQ